MQWFMDYLNARIREMKSGHMQNLTAASNELLLKQRFKNMLPKRIQNSLTVKVFACVRSYRSAK